MERRQGNRICGHFRNSGLALYIQYLTDFNIDSYRTLSMQLYLAFDIRTKRNVHAGLPLATVGHPVSGKVWILFRVRAVAPKERHRPSGPKQCPSSPLACIQPRRIAAVRGQQELPETCPELHSLRQTYLNQPPPPS